MPPAAGDDVRETLRIRDTAMGFNAATE